MKHTSHTVSHHMENRLPYMAQPLNLVYTRLADALLGVVPTYSLLGHAHARPCPQLAQLPGERSPQGQQVVHRELPTRHIQWHALTLMPQLCKHTLCAAKCLFSISMRVIKPCGEAVREPQVAHAPNLPARLLHHANNVALHSLM